MKSPAIHQGAELTFERISGACVTRLLYHILHLYANNRIFYPNLLNRSL